MQIDSVKFSNLNPNFGGQIVDTYALRKFKSGLSHIEADTFEKYISDVEKVNDNKKYVFKPILTGNSKIYKIHRVDKNGNPINPPLFVDYGKNPMNIFKQIANRYKRYFINDCKGV